jgi:hypothetical protein
MKPIVALPVAMAMPLFLAACSADLPSSESADALESPTTPVAAAPSQEPFPTPTPSQSPESIKGDNPGCGEIQLGGHFEGEGLAKRWVAGPIVKTCDTQASAPEAVVPSIQSPNIVANNAQ